MKRQSLIDRMGTTMIMGLFLGAVAVSTATAGAIHGVNVDFNGGAGTYSGQAVLDVSADNWNGFNTESTSSGSELLDSQGNPTEVGWSLDSGVRSYNGKNGAGKLLDDWGYMDGSKTLTITGLDPDAWYDLVIFSQGNKNGRGGQFTLNGTTKKSKSDKLGDSTFTEGGNYVHFEAVTPDSGGELVLTWKNPHGRYSVLNGFQIQSVLPEDEAALDEFFDQEQLAKTTALAQYDAVALAAVGKLTNEKALYWLAQNAEDAEIRFSAVSKLTNTQALANIAKGDDNKRIRYVAAQRIPDEERPADLNIEFDPSSIDSDRLWKITDASRLTEIALNSDESKEKRLEAIWALTDQQKLFDIATQARNYDMRLAAAKKITDRNMLSLDHKEPAIRHRIALEISDQDQLKQIVKNDSHDAVRAAATRRVTDKTFLKRVATSNLPIPVRVAAVKGLESRSAELQRVLFKSDSDKLRQSVLQNFGNKMDIGRGPAELNAEEPFVSFKGPNSYIDLTFGCDPEKQNYLTVKVWGGSAGNELYLKGAGELLEQREASPFPGRFYYATYPIPKEWTSGKSTVEVTLKSDQNKWHNPGWPGPDVYKVYTHTGAFIQPPANELQGEPFELGPPRPEPDSDVTLEEAFESWKFAANTLLKQSLKNAQLYDGQMSGAPEWTHGAIVEYFIHSDPNDASDSYATEDSEIRKWGGMLVENMGANLGAMPHLENFARAYKLEWSNYHQDEEMVDRVASAIDFYAKAQGSDGGFKGGRYGGTNNEKWVGAPNRKKGKHSLETGQAAMYRAWRLLFSEMEKSGKLDEPIDHDLLPETRKIPRRAALRTMAKRSFTKMKANSIGSSVANQNLHNFPGFYEAYRVIEKGYPELASELDQERRRIVKIIAGLKKQPKYDHYMFSPDGLSQENGYSANPGYGGTNPKRLAGVYRQTDLEFVKERVRDAYEAYNHFHYFDNDDDGHRRLENVGWLSRRGRAGIPGGQFYMSNRYAAHELEVPVAIRHRQLQRKHNRGGNQVRLQNLVNSNGRSTDQVNRINLAKKTRNAIHRAESLRKQLESKREELPSTDYRIPAEREADSAFVDPRNQAATLRHGDGTLFIRMWGGDIARLRYRHPAFERLAHIPVDHVGPGVGAYFGHGHMLNVMRYGPYLVVMNYSEEQAYEFEVPKPFRKSADNTVKELQANEVVELSATESVPPMEGYAFAIE